MKLEEMLKNIPDLSSHPAVALETTVLTHGMPYPQNVECALACEEEIRKAGGTILTGAKVVRIVKNSDNVLTSVVYEKDGEEITVNGDYVISSMPIRDLVAGMNDVPADPARIAAGLPYRDYMTVGVLIDHLNLENKTKNKTIGNIVPDNWVYVHDRSVTMGRFQIYNN